VRLRALVIILYGFATKQKLGGAIQHYLGKEVQYANLWASSPAILTKTSKQVKLIIPKAGSMAHTFQSTVCTGKVEPQRRRLACWVGTDRGY
jgi:hypothetical protein